MGESFHLISLITRLLQQWWRGLTCWSMLCKAWRCQKSKYICYKNSYSISLDHSDSLGFHYFSVFPLVFLRGDSFFLFSLLWYNSFSLLFSESLWRFETAIGQFYLFKTQYDNSFATLLSRKHLFFLSLHIWRFKLLTLINIFFWRF